MRDWLSHRVVSSPDDTALVRAEDGEAWSYTDLDRLVAETAGRLVAHGLDEGDRIGVLTPPYVGTVGLVHATMRIGATFVPLGQELTPREIAARIDRTDLDAVVCAEPTEPTATDAAAEIEGVPVYSVDDPTSAEVTGIHDVDPASLDPPEWSFEDPLCVLFTSGTTGEPKPVPLTAGNVYSSAVASGFRLGVEADDRWLVSLSLHHMGGLAPVYRSVLYGTTLVLREGFDAGGTADDIDAYDVTGVSLVPTMLKRMLDRRGTLSDSLRVVLLGGAPAPAELLERCRDYSVPVYPTYGMTEAASQITTAAPRQTRGRIGTVGRPLFGTDVTVVDDDGNPAEPGETGEIVVSGPTITPGYLAEDDGDAPDADDGGDDGDSPDANDEGDEADSPDADDEGDDGGPEAAFGAEEIDLNGIDPGDLDRSDFGPYGLHTGDVGRFDEDGYLHVLNRVDDRIISGGENVEPGEVADVLRKYDEIDDVAVVGLDDEVWGERVAALVAVGDRFPSTATAPVEGDASEGGDSEQGDSQQDDSQQDDSQQDDSQQDDSQQDDLGDELADHEPTEHEPADHEATEQSAGTATPAVEAGGIGPAPIDEAAFVAFARERLARFKIPKTIAYVDDLPRTVSGTVDREATRALLRERGADPRRNADSDLETAGFEPADPAEPAESAEPPAESEGEAPNEADPSEADSDDATDDNSAVDERSDAADEPSDAPEEVDIADAEKIAAEPSDEGANAAGSGDTAAVEAGERGDDDGDASAVDEG